MRVSWAGALLLLVCAAPLHGQQTDSIVPAVPAQTLSEALSGRAPGVVVLSKDGSVGAGSSVYVRGSSQPLLVIDGVRADNDAGGDNPAAANHPAPARFDDLDPSEIDHIEVLPGASAAAIYGPDAGNGVILVTTKRASAKSKGEITLEGARLETPVDLPANYYAWGHHGGTPKQCLTYLRAEGQCTLDSVTSFNPFVSAATSPLATVYQDRIGGSVEGTSATQRLWLGGHYANDPGTLEMPAPDQAIYATRYGFAPARSHTLPNRLQEGDVRGSFGADFSKTVDATVNAGYMSQYQRDPSTDAVVSNAAAGPGFVGLNDGWPDSLSRPANDLANVARENTRHFNGGVTIGWVPNARWTTHATLGVDAVDQTAGDIYAPSPSLAQISAYNGYDHTRFTQYTADAGGTLTAGDSATRSQTTLGLQYLAEHFHDSTALSEGTIYSRTERDAWVGPSSQSRSAYGREVLTFGNKLVLAGGLRFDNQRFRALNLASWTLNPSVNSSLALIGSAADPRLRLRASVGQTSTLPDAREIEPIATVEGPGFGCSGLGLTGCPIVPPVRAERQREWEGGFDASVPNGRFTIGAALYSQRSVHQLVPGSIPVTAPSFPVPLLLPDALVTNRGVEFSMSARLADRPTFQWDVGLDASENTNKMLRATLPLFHFGTSALPVEASLDHPIAGAFTTPYTYSDANHDGVIEQNEVTLGGVNSAYVGSAVPTHLASGSMAIQMLKRRLRLATLFDYRGGYVLPALAPGSGGLAANARAVNVPGASLGDQAAAVAQMSLIGQSVPFQRVSALRWRELSATVGSTGAHKLQLTVAVRNLALWTGYRGADPDWDIAAPTASGFPAMELPEPRTWLLRVTAGF